MFPVSVRKVYTALNKQLWQLEAKLRREKGEERRGEAKQGEARRGEETRGGEGRGDKVGETKEKTSIFLKNTF